MTIRDTPRPSCRASERPPARFRDALSGDGGVGPVGAEVGGGAATVGVGAAAAPWAGGTSSAVRASASWAAADGLTIGRAVVQLGTILRIRKVGGGRAETVARADPEAVP